ncbi:MAG: glycosyltransferase family 4 protein [Hyphomicrobiaceae bacterium]|nr:glycosyltransferase family 4 protein [Hyphomicrobiaceae bacterium]
MFVNRYFHPDLSATSQMLSDIAFRLAARGWRVTVVTSRQLYEDARAELPVRETIAGVEVVRVSTTSFGRRTLALRAADYASFYVAAAVALARIVRTGDVVIAKTDPPLLSLVAGPVTRLKGARLVNWLQDLFPEVASGVGMGRGRLARIGFAALKALRDRSCRIARRTVVLGERMHEAMAARGIAHDRLAVIANFADGRLITPVARDRNPLRRAWGLDGSFVVGYSGNLGRAHDAATLLAAMECICSGGGASRTGAAECGAPRVVWLFIGGGKRLDELRAEVRQRGYGNVVFQPYQPREALALSLSAADVHLVSLMPELEGAIVPSKIYGIAAAGRPAIFIGDGDGEVARLVRRHGSGVTVAPGDGAGLAAAILQLAGDPARAAQMGEAARRAFETENDVAIAVERWDALLTQVTNRTAG